MLRFNSTLAINSQDLMDHTQVLQLDPTPGNARNSEGAFITLRDGRILFAWSKYITENHSDHGRCQIVGRYSSDGGRSWAAVERVFVDVEGALNVMSVSLLRLHTGRIALLYVRKDPTTNGALYCMPMIRFSDDEMESLSPPTSLIPVPSYHVVNNDRMIQLQDGRLVVPIAQHRFRGPSQPGGVAVCFADPALIFYLLSDDEGLTWLESRTSYYRCFADGCGLQEPGVIELKDGRLWSWTRTGWRAGEAASRQWQSFSEDGGQSWSEPQPSQFVSPCSPLSMKRIPQTGDLLAVWNDHSNHFALPSPLPISNQRTPLVCSISRDDGATWKHRHLLEEAPDHGYCYTAIHFTDNAVLLAYCAGGASSRIILDTLRVRRIEVDALYN